MELRLGSGEKVVDRPNSHTCDHIGVAQILPTALLRVSSGGRDFIVERIDFKEVIGVTICVVTGPDDKIIYARRPNRFGLSRFVMNREPEPSSIMTAVLKQNKDGGYILITAFIGHRSEPEPWNSNATEVAREFWKSHALVWGCEEVVPNTETFKCPW